jgi:arginine decarboxylase
MPMKHWTVQDAATLYGIREWGSGYFGINAKGHLEITPTKDESLSCDVYEIVQHLKKKGIRTPVNLRFPQVLADRVIEVNESFRKAIIEFGYEGGYQGVYPVKTNQTKEVVEEIVRAGNKYHYGLEAGSKPELMIALSIDLHPEALVLCNGYKDEILHPHGVAGAEGRPQGGHHRREDDRTAADPEGGQGTQGRAPHRATRQTQCPWVRGKWETSAGDHAKFGLTTQEILEAIETLEKRDLLDCVIELHFHIGSQITDIRK